MKNLFKFKERLASGVRRYGRVLSLIVTLTALSCNAWSTTFGIKGNDYYGFPSGMTEMTANGTTFTYSFSAKNGGESWFKLYKDKTENNNNMVSCSSTSKFAIGTQYNCKIDGTYHELKVDLTKGVTYTVTVVYTSNSNVKVTISNASPTPTTTVPSIRIGKKAVVDGTNVTFNGQIADWGCANVTKVMVYYSTSGNPTKSSSKKEITLSPAIGSNANTGVLNTTGWASGTYTYALTATNNKGESELSDFGTFTVQACTPPTLNIPGRDASQTTSMSFNCKATAMGDCTIESWGLKAYTNSACTGDPVATKVATDVLSTSNQKLQLTGLTANTRYYVKLYAVLDGGTTITSEAREWQTKVALEASSEADIVCDGATLSAGSKTGGNCTTVLKEARFRYSTIESDVTGNKGQTSVTGVTSVGSPFSATLTGLTPNTKYYYRTEITFTAAGSGLEMQTNCPTKSFTTAAASCTAGPAPTFANVVLGQSGTAQNATFTYCGYDNFTYELSGANAGDFQLGSATASNGTITLPVTFKPTSTGVGSKTANIIVKSNDTQVATMTISATALCITPTKANYSVSGNVHTYDGSPKTAVITPNTGSTYGDFITGTATYEGAASQTNVGEYTIHYTVPAGGNYCAANFDFDEKLTISNATLPEITELPAETVTKCSEETEQLTPALGGAIVGAVSWSYSSSAPGVATVSDAGLITFKGAGNATITVTATNPNYNDKSADVSVTTNAAPAISASTTNTTAYEVITLESTSGSVTWSKSDAAAYFVKNNQAVDSDTVDAVSVNFKAPAKNTDYTVTAEDSNGCTSNLNITIREPQETCN